MAKNDTSDDIYAEARAAILAAALPSVALDGWTGAVLARAIDDAGIETHIAIMAFPEKTRDLTRYFVEAGDALMLEQLRGVEPTELKIRERIIRAVQARLEADAQHKQAVRRLVAYHAGAEKSGQGAGLLFQTSDAIWRWAGDSATDYNYYTKRAILSGVLAATRLVWLGDDAEGFDKSFAFLDRRIGDVMRFESFKAKARARAEDIRTRTPDPFDILARLRYGRG